ncbi:MAG: 4-hydroxybenzoate octaprenyltransferase [Pseudomonadota bacterium]
MTSSAETPTQDGAVADAAKGNWVDARAPAAWRPYLRLMRADRPIGVWLLVIPGWIAIALAAEGAPDLQLILLFFIGAIVMRGAGCAVNDIVDRNIDAEVARTRSRPLPSGQISLMQALVFTAALCVVGLAVLLQLNRTAILTGFAALGLIAAYPFMKRITALPQAWLGLNMSYGALLGWAAAAGEIPSAAWALYASGVLWTVGYDTIYAHQDREDDALLGVGSSALLFGRRTGEWLVALYAGAVLFAALAGLLTGAGPAWFLGVAAFSIHLAWQVRALDIDDGGECLRLFKSNRDAGLILVVGAAADGLIRLA